MLASLTAAIQRTSSRFNRQVPEITIAANFGFTHLWLLPRLPLLQETFADIRFSLVPDDSGTPTLSREADIAITFDQQAPSARDEILLAEEVVFPVCSPAFAQAMGLGARLTKQNLESCTLLHMDEQNRRWLDWTSWGIMAGYGAVHRYSGFAFNNYPLLLNAALDGQGLMLGWSALVKDQVEQGALLAFEPQVTRAGYGYLLKSHKSKNTLVKPVIDWLVKQFMPMH
ncbi:LysR substrate-binding domain-containing protein [Pseudomonas sp. LTJR-52]|uniref:LysR substrate-binding domain-containing protein n=1 Tax=Pseudomonas sp. LTJR-52 TaxID=2479392 RepID=UPI0021141EBF|nr:LysR substrate-binding domain-containing protein [Pseudomonas sp. LTJR-52]